MEVAHSFETSGYTIVYIVKIQKTATVLVTTIFNCIFNVLYITDIWKHTILSSDSIAEETELK